MPGEEGTDLDDGSPKAGDARPIRFVTEARLLLVLGLGLVLWLVGEVLLVVFAGILFAIALDALAMLLSERTRLPRRWSLVVVALGLLAGIVGASAWLLPTIAEQIRDVWREFGSVLARLERFAIDRLRLDELIADGMNGDANAVGGFARDVAGHVATVSVTLAAAVTAFFVIVALGIFVAAAPDLYREGLVKFVPRHRRARAREVLATLGFALRWWLIGQLASMLILGVVMSFGLWLLGVRLWLGLGVLTGLFTFVPVIGPLVAGVPVVLLGFAEGVQTGIAVLVFYLIVQNLEGYVLTPMIQHKAVHIPPAVLITTGVLMTVLFGVPGLILAAPLTAVGLVLVKQLYFEDVLGEENQVEQ